jgi:tetratricopeptide (TPR) repeat protein
LRLLGLKAALWVNRVEVGDTEDQYTYAEWSGLLAALSAVLDFGVLVPLTLAGVVATWGRRRDAKILAGLLAVYALSVIATYVMARYRHPALPLLVLFAAAALVEIPILVRERAWPRAGGALALAGLVAFVAHRPLVSEATVRSASLYNLGRVFSDRPGELETAAAYYRSAIALEPNYALAHNNLGTVLQRQGHLPEAIVALRRATELRPERGEYHYNLAGALAASGDSDAAIAVYQRAIALQPGDAHARKNLGVVRQQRGEYAEAVREYAAALAIAPQDAGTLNNLGVLYIQQGRRDAAIDSFRKALAADPAHISARENLARALAENADATPQPPTSP